MRYRAVLPTLCLSVLAACGGEDAPDPTPNPEQPDPRVEAILALSGDPAAGEQIYLGNCAGCHLADGTGRSNGGAGKDLTDWLPRNEDAAAVDAVLDGRTGMLAYRDLFDDQEVADLLAHLRAAFDP